MERTERVERAERLFLCMTPQASGLGWLPDDLLSLVLSFTILSSASDFSPCVLVSKQFQRCCSKKAAHLLITLHITPSLLIPEEYFASSGPSSPIPASPLSPAINTACPKLNAASSLLAAMRSLPHLRLLGDQQTNGNKSLVNDVTLSVILNSPWTSTLTSLDLSDCCGISDRGFFPPVVIHTTPLARSKPMPQLRNLVLASCQKLTDVAVLRFPHVFPSLTHLDLSNCYRIKDASLGALAELKKLVKLDLSGCDELTDTGLVVVASYLLGLEVLCLSGCSRVGDDSLVAFAVLRKLRELNVSNCKRVTNLGVESLGQLTKLRMVLVYGTSINRKQAPFTDNFFLIQCRFF